MRYVIAFVYADDGPLLGHAVLDTESDKFTSLNMFPLEEAQDEAARQNEATAIKAHWPAPDDPEVLAILVSPEFTLDETMTLAYSRYLASEIVARRRAGLPAAP